MNKFITVIFDTENEAYQGARAIEELHDEGSLVLYSRAVVWKKPDESFEVKDSSDRGPLGMTVGAFTGFLVGLFAGPGGALVGTVAGGSGGALYDLGRMDIDFDYVNQIQSYLSPDSYAVIAEVEESWTMPLDSRMEELGGFVLRKYRSDFVDERVEQDINFLKQEFHEIKDEFHESVGHAKAKLQKNMNKVEREINKRIEQVQKYSDDFKEETYAKIDLLRDKQRTATQEMKESLEKRIQHLEAEYDRRTAKLKEAEKLAREALTYESPKKPKAG